MDKPLKLEAFREMVVAGVIKTALVRGLRGGYTVLANMGTQLRPLGTKLGRVRMFGSIDTASKVLREIGLFHYTLDTTNFEEGRLRAARPDVTEKAKAASAALAHERWVIAQIDEALAEEERGDAVWLDHDAMWDELEAYTIQAVAARDQRDRAAFSQPKPAASVPREVAARAKRPRGA